MGTGLELFGLRRDGSEFPVEISLSPMISEDGETLIISNIRDVTARKIADERLRAAAADLARSNADRRTTRGTDPRGLGTGARHHIPVYFAS